LINNNNYNDYQLKTYKQSALSTRMQIKTVLNCLESQYKVQCECDNASVKKHSTNIRAQQ